MADDPDWTGFGHEIRAALALLQDSAPDGRPRPDAVDLPATSLPSLLEQCRRLLAETSHQNRPSLRSLHHFACTGGTLISRCIAAMPNTCVLSEADPLSPLWPTDYFAPSDMVSLARLSSHPPDRDVLIEIFLSGLDVLYRQSRATGTTLILRDHTHSHFCTGPTLPERPDLGCILGARFPLLSLVTVRHPLDSFCSLQNHGWIDFAPATLDEYCRRYGVFLDTYPETPVLRYEDFVATPAERMQEICAVLDLRYNPDFTVLFSALRLSGNSGRKGDTIGARPRRGIRAPLKEQAAESSRYAGLCARLGYDPSFD